MEIKNYTDEFDLNLLEEEMVFYESDKDFITLEAWKKAREMKLFFYLKVIPLLPDDEKFNLSSQIKRAGVSSTANIAEGYPRFNAADEIRFFLISRCSQKELKDHLITCDDLKYISHDIYVEGSILLQDSMKLLNGYIRYVAANFKKKK